MRLLQNCELSEAAKACFFSVEEEYPCRFVKVCGPTRSGKSTFANTLCPNSTFTSSNSCEPCTQGVDFSAFEPIRSFSERHNVPTDSNYLVSIIDVEGGGDQSSQHDVKNLLPSFMLPGVIVWNVLGHPPRNDLLTQLGVMGMIGNLLKGAPSASCTFPNDLIIVIRDYTLESPPCMVETRLLELEDVPTDKQRLPQTQIVTDAAERNRLRKHLKASFLSIKVFTLPVRSSSAYAEAESFVIQSIITKLLQNATKLTPAMCWDLLSDLTKQIREDSSSVNVGSTMAYLTLSNFNRCTNQAEALLRKTFDKWFHESQYVTNEADTIRQFSSLFEQCWKRYFYSLSHVPEECAVSLPAFKESFFGRQKQLLLDPRMAELRLMDAERTICQLELAAFQSRRDQDLARYCEKEALDNASGLFNRLKSTSGNKQEFQEAFKQALGNPRSFEYFYKSNEFDSLVNAYIRPYRAVIGEETLKLGDALQVEEVFDAQIMSKIEDVLIVNDILKWIK